MKYFFTIIIFVHSLLHIMFFVKVYEIKKFKEITLPISKQIGNLWLLAAILLILYIFLYLFNSKYSWLFGFMAVIISQFLIFYFWKDAKFGAIPNLILLIVSFITFGNFLMVSKFESLKEYIINNNVEINKINLNKLDQLPQCVQNWLKNSGALDKEKIAYAKITQKAKLKMKPEQNEWLDANAIQYTTFNNPAFIWFVDVKMNSFLSFQGIDKFMDGTGGMLIKINSLVKIVDEKGPKLDESTVQRYLGEIVWFPRLALSPYIKWEQINDSTAIATMEFNGVKGSGTFHFNKFGDVVKFEAMRYKGNDPDSKKYNWVITITDYKNVDGIKIPAKMYATWKLEDGDWTWILLEIEKIQYF